MIGVVGAGAFGTALAVALARDGRKVRLWARDAAHVEQMRKTGRNDLRLPSIELPENVTVTAEINDLTGAQTVLLSLPMQSLQGFLTTQGAVLNGLPLIACCKGLDLATLRGPTDVITYACPASAAAILTGPSFAADIARGLPTALTLAGGDEALQHLLSTPTLRLYRTTDVVGAELGGALKNVIAIAAGIVIGAGLGESARAALMTRGYAEMVRFGLRFGAREQTLAGLSGFGDLVLTCTSGQSRNFAHGVALGRGEVPVAATVEGVATAQAVVQQAIRFAMVASMPVSSMVVAVTTGRINVEQAVQTLMSRPLKEE